MLDIEEEPDDDDPDDDVDDDDADPGPTTEEIAATPFEEAVKRNPVELWRKYQEHAPEKENRQEGRRRAAETRRRNQQQAHQQRETGKTEPEESAEDEDETESDEPHQQQHVDPAHVTNDAAKRRQEQIKGLVKVIIDAIWERRTDLTLAEVREAIREVTAQVDSDEWRGQFEIEPEPEPTIH